MGTVDDEALFAELLELVRPRLRGGDATVVASSDLVADLGLDSLSMWDVIVAIEDHFSIQIDEQDLPRLRTFGDVVSLIAEKRRC